MANQRRKPAVPSFLLNPAKGLRTGLELEKLTQQERKIVEEKLDELLTNEISTVKERITERLPGKEKAVDKIFARLKKLKASSLAEKNIGEIISGAVGEEEKKLFNKEELDVLDRMASDLEGAKVKDVLNMDVPLKDNPLFSKELARAKNIEYARIIGLKEDKSELLGSRDIDLINADESLLEEMVKKRILTPKQKNDLLVTSRLSRLTGENFELLEHLTKKKVPEPSEIIAMNSDDWLKLIKDKKVSIPDGEENSESYADALRETVERSYPTEFYLKRTIRKESAITMSGLAKSVEPLVKNKVSLFSGNITDLDELENDAWRNIGTADKKKIKKDFAELRQLVNTHRHLGIGEVIDSGMPHQEKQKEITLRIDILDKFYSNNPLLDIRMADLTANPSFVKEDGYNWQGINTAERPMVKRQMSAYQRAYILGGKHETAGSLLKNGFDSAYDIVSIPEDLFIDKSGLGIETGRAVYTKAVDLALGATHYFEAIRDGVLGNFKDISVANQYPLVNDLKEIDGFDKLFGSQDYCDCEHCRSIFSPAAYFTDLMFFIRDNISSKVFTGSKVNHPLYLKRRRPDLWELPLTCSNTTTEIPYLEVVNEVLERYLKTTLGVSNPYSFLVTADRSVHQPFNLYLEELRIYLGHFDVHLHDLYRMLDLQLKEQHREKMGLSDEELKIVTTKDSASAKKRFGNKPLNKFNVQDFLGYAGITREQLDHLLQTTFLPEIAKVTVGREKAGDDIQQFTEVLNNLTEIRLDLIHRYIRLWKKTPWSIREYDLILTSCKSAGLFNNLEDTSAGGYKKILQLGRILILQEKLKLFPEEMAAIIYRLPDKPVVENQKAFAERTFDTEKLADPAVADKTPWLLAGLAVPEADLLLLSDLLSIDLTQAPDAKNLAALYRHARVARALKMNMEDLVGSLTLVNGNSPLTSLEDIEKITEYAGRVKETPLKTGEIVFITDGIETTLTRYKIASRGLAEKIVEIQGHDTVAGETDPALKMEKAGDLLENYFLAQFNITSGQFRDEFLPGLVSVDFGLASEKALNAAFTGSEPDNPADLNDLMTVIKELERFTLLVNRMRLEPGSVSYLLENPEAFGITDLKALTAENIFYINHYRELLLKRDDFIFGLHNMIDEIQADSSLAGSAEILAGLYDRPVSLLTSLTASLSYSAPALGALIQLDNALEVCNTLGIQGESLIKLVSKDYRRASGIALGAFKSKYDDEQNRQEKLEPYTDKINTLKRDALCDYIISREDKFKFKERGDLYSFFLLSVEMSGCARTSRLVAAISSLQLYIHRCLINLEQSDPWLNPGMVKIKVQPTLIPADEWEWRKNYRVWEANRKVFLYPENYIDPTLRPSKTGLFRELEEELLQQKITTQSAEDAYKKYLAGFAELTRLRYAGGYYHRVYDNHGYFAFQPNTGNITGANSGAGSTSSGTGTASAGTGSNAFVAGNTGVLGVGANAMSSGLQKAAIAAQAYLMVNTLYFPKESDESQFYLFARTNVQPYKYYYRTYNDNKKIWGNWEKIDLTIEAREISSLIHLGRLYIFWTESKSKEMTTLEEGTSSTDGFIFTGYTKYSILDENGKWSAPQRLLMGEDMATRQTIYKRARNTSGWSSSRWEKEKDALVEKFEQLVFRKPYAYKNNSNVSNPVGFGFIWTANTSDQTAKYTTKVYNYFKNFGLYTLKFTVPSTQFEISNNDFSNPSKTRKQMNIQGTMEVFFPVYQKITISFMAEIQLGHGVCIFSASIKVGTHLGNISIRIMHFLQYDIVMTNHPARENHFNLSLARNEITNKRDRYLFGLNSLNFYYKEYESAFTENGDFITHFEHGEKVLSGHKLFQDRDGIATIKIAVGNGIEDVPASTILTDELSDVLYARGLEHFLSLPTQQMTDKFGQMFDFEGPYGQYYWEMFFHIPFTIANHFNANQKFREAKWWYERIFNPTSDETPADTSPTDHNWQFREFRGLTPDKLRDILADQTAIEVYKNDPFDPHAIARLRISSYQKAVVMKYIDNLLDWGDHLFTQDTRESINEAEMLYKLAFDILGKRPVKMGKCDTADENSLTWDKLSGPHAKGSDFLITLENYYWTRKERYINEVGLIKRSKNLIALTGKYSSEVDLQSLEANVSIKKAGDLLPWFKKASEDSSSGPVAETKPAWDKWDMAMEYNAIARERMAVKESNVAWITADKEKESKPDFDNLRFRPHRRMPSFELVRQESLAFCVPENKDLIDYWDRVEDRLFKIWNCMNIKGVRRSLSLFQPPIDPMMLVRARASGLSLEDAIAMAIGGALPHYRFVYLIEKARQFAQVTQGFGSALLGALEKKDTEELLRLRSVHEKNILKMTTTLRKDQVREALEQAESVRESLKNVQNRIDYYSQLIDTGLIPWEVVEQISKWTGGSIRIGEATLGFMSSVFGFLPQVGSPFAMKYGGMELSSGTGNLAHATGTLAAIADNIAILAGMEAGHQRREQEWKQQLSLSEQEYKQVDKQLLAAEIRHGIAQHDLAIHEKNVEQVDEVDDFYKNKFTNLGLYNYMASSLNRIYRSAYNISVEMARMAEKAYQFETFSNDIYIQNDNWQFDRAGLLSGEKLMQQLQELETAYIKSNERVPEITQNLSLAMIDSSRLVQLRQTGSCDIRIPEVAFEVLYPGQFRRVIKSVRVTIPCIAGPYTNISARLTLLKGEIENSDGADLEEITVAKNTSITTSSANNDSGVFELDFRDERYLPFEGAGAVSEWRLELPEKLRSFDYNTISDVILHISYTALDGDRAAAENDLADRIEEHATSHGLHRLLSLRHDFSGTFHRLLDTTDQQSEFTISKQHFPYILADKDLILDKVTILLKPVAGTTVTVPSNLKINGNNTVSWSAAEDIELPGAAGNTDKIKGGTVNLTGSPVKQWTIEAGTGGFDKDNLEDILVLIRYKI